MRSILLALIWIPTLAHGYELRGKLYEKGTDRTKLLFDWQRTEKNEGSSTITKSVFTAPDKSIAVVDEAVVTDGKIRKYEVHHFQLGQEGSVVVDGNKLHFSYTKDGKTESNTEDLPEQFAVAATLVDTLGRNRELILRGDTLKLRYAVLDRKETIGFSFFKVEEKKVNGVEAVVIKMKPSSFIISALVDPLLFTLRKDDFRVMELVGRTLPKRKVEQQWKDLDCDIVYF
jgi:hypothetical protein